MGRCMVVRNWGLGRRQDRQQCRDEQQPARLLEFLGGKLRDQTMVAGATTRGAVCGEYATFSSDEHEPAIVHLIQRCSVNAGIDFDGQGKRLNWKLGRLYES